MTSLPYLPTMHALFSNLILCGLETKDVLLKTEDWEDVDCIRCRDAINRGWILADEHGNIATFDRRKK